MTRRLVVSGDVVIDHHIYEGERAKPGQEVRGAVMLTEVGGAVQLGGLIDLALCKGLGWKVELGVAEPFSVTAGPGIPHAFATWTSSGTGKDKATVWRPATILGYGDAPKASARLAMTDVPAGFDLLVLDDAGDKFRLLGQRACWHLPTPDTATGKRCWIVLKLSDPVARGDLWSAIQEAKLERDRFVCVVSAADLRRESVSFRPGLSWDRTIDEVHAALQHHRLQQLKECQHLVVTFSSDGALWIRKGEPSATLVFSANGYEGRGLEGQQSRVIGGMSVMTAAIARQVALHIGNKDALDLEPAIKAGLAGMEELQAWGHGPVESDETQLGTTRFVAPKGYPAARVAGVIRTESDRYAAVVLPWPQAAAAPASIIASSQYPHDIKPAAPMLGLARQIAMYGVRALAQVPYMEMGDSIVVDRTEIETLRGLERSMRAYRDEKSRPGETPRPFSIGVFGPPGAGKSRGVKTLATQLLGKECWLEFNLSQFSGAGDLRGAFHQVRDVVLGGRTPLVFWDEFDSNGYEWLRHLLAPMQDGRFQDGELNHAVGKSIFVFAGGTSERYADFGPAGRSETEQADWRLKKGPDFVSRLDAFYDVAGANPRRRRVLETGRGQRAKDVVDEGDVTYPVRRALMIRHHLGCGAEDALDFDSDLLDALLLAPRYHHGSRSLEKLVRPLRPAKGDAVRRSALPSIDSIHMHVDAAALEQVMTRLDAYRTGTAKLAEIAGLIYAGWVKDEREFHEEQGKTFDPPAYAALAPTEREVNVAAAMRLPEVLAMAGMTVAPKESAGGGITREQFDSLVRLRLEAMAEVEHDGWVRQRRAAGWRAANERKRELREHETLVPYKDLDDRFKDKDRMNVKRAWERLDDAGFAVVWLEPPIAAGRWWRTRVNK